MWGNRSEAAAATATATAAVVSYGICIKSKLESVSARQAHCDYSNGINSMEMKMMEVKVQTSVQQP